MRVLLRPISVCVVYTARTPLYCLKVPSLWLAALVLLFTVQAARADVTVFAAASLQGVLEEASQTFSQDVLISYGGSGAIARQIVQGAPADVVILAHPRWMDWLTERMRGQNAPRNVLQNSLVLIAPKTAPLDQIDPRQLPDLLANDRLAMGQYLSVPAGIYGSEWLRNLNLWNRLQSNLAQTNNVRLALTLVARGEVPFGLVYQSDARTTQAVKVVHSVDPSLHAPISYPALALTAEGSDWLDHVFRPDAVPIFAQAGFEPVFAKAGPL